jgi:hypothetical protein
MVKILIIGSGWYGCHAACYLLDRKVDVQLIDKEAGLFSGASSKNQNRLHLGYHYPRSPETIYECKRGYSRFIQLYKEVVYDVPNNYYIIHSGSKTSLDTYKQLFNLDDEHSEYGVLLFRVNEKFIDNKQALHNFSKVLIPYFKQVTEIKMEVHADYISVNDCKYDAVINCTNNQWVPLPIPFTPTYEVFCSFVYMIDFDEPTAFTVMDGEYFSIYPYDLRNNYYTLTHVKHGVISRSDRLEIHDPDKHTLETRRYETEKEVFELLPLLREKMIYKTYFLSYKTKYDFVNDDRSVRIFRDGRYSSFSGGKITGIFDTEPFLEEILVCCQKEDPASLASPENNSLSTQKPADFLLYDEPVAPIPDPNTLGLEN